MSNSNVTGFLHYLHQLHSERSVNRLGNRSEFITINFNGQTLNFLVIPRFLQSEVYMSSICDAKLNTKRESSAIWL